MRNVQRCERDARGRRLRCKELPRVCTPAEMRKLLFEEQNVNSEKVSPFLYEARARARPTALEQST